MNCVKLIVFLTDLITLFGEIVNLSALLNVYLFKPPHLPAQHIDFFCQLPVVVFQLDY